MSKTDIRTSPSRFINREYSWLQFNHRVLEEAENLRHPLMERLKFLSISAENLDEFLMVRVAGLAGQVRENVKTLSDNGKTPIEQLSDATKTIDGLQQQQCLIWDQLRTELATQNIKVLKSDELSESERTKATEYFHDSLFPVLTPLCLDPAHPFPFIPNLGLTLILRLEHKDGSGMMNALLRLPNSIARFVLVNDNSAKQHYIALEDLVELFIDDLFPDYKLREKGIFRLVRDSDIEVEEEAEDLVLFYETALKRRRLGQVVRAEFTPDTPTLLRDFVMKQCDIDEDCAHNSYGMLALDHLRQIVDSGPTRLHYDVYTPRFPERIREHNGDCLAAIRQKDLIVHHPYESFDVVISFLNQAANDPDVVAIKQTLYRTSNDSPIVKALISAAEQGKSVTALVELKARFDEEANIRWAKDLERAGVQVVYGFLELKTHAKLSVVSRRESGKIRNYVHIGTGNYHPVNALCYTDLSFFSDDEQIANDVVRIFNFITGSAPIKDLNKLLVSPSLLRPSIVSMINIERENAKSGKPAMIWMKMNSLVDPKMIDLLYQASNDGVQIDLIVRGICCLRPQVEGLSENIRVKSIIGRFLEHGRIYCFANGHKLPSRHAKIYVGSADLMPRNLDRRVEVLVPLENETIHQQVLDQIMVGSLSDTSQSWEILPTGRAKRITSERVFSAQDWFMTNPSLSGRGKSIETDAPRSISSKD